MSIFNELILLKILEISNQTKKDFDDELKGALECLNKFEEEFVRGRSNGRNKPQNEKTLMTTTLQSINEDDGESNKTPETNPIKVKETTTATNNEAEKEQRRVTKKRSKEEVEGMLSPEVDKRQKRNASVKAQSIISQQVNVNLSQKLRREESSEGTQSRGRRRKDDNKENARPFPLLQVKLEKISMPPEPMDMESLPVNIQLKKEPNKDDIAMPPPTAPVPKPRKALQKDTSAESSEDESGTGKKRSTRGRKPTETIPPPTEPRKALQKDKSAESSEDESGTGKKRSTRGRKPTETMPPPTDPVPSARSTRASARASSRAKPVDEATPDAPPVEARPKRTRGRKKASESAPPDLEKEKPLENGIGSPAEKPRPKRTRRAQKAAEKEAEIQSSQEVQPPIKPQIPLKTERISQPESKSPVLQKVLKPPKNYNKNDEKKTKSKKDKQNSQEDSRSIQSSEEVVEKSAEVDGKAASKTVLNETRVIEDGGEMDRTMVLPNGVYNHAPVTPKSVNAANATVVLDVCNRETMVLDARAPALNATVVIDKDPKVINITDDNSLITNDSDSEVHTPQKAIPNTQPTSAVKEKVQQFEELAARTTRTKTRAMAKMEEPDNQTPPDQLIKPILSAETLSKMNSMIFNGKPPQISSSATKPRAIPPPKPLAASTSKLSSSSRQRDAAEEAKRQKEDARKKKEAMLEAKRELQKKKREEKMAAAAAAREAAEKERKLAMEQAARDRMEKQAHADQGKLERLKEVERKKQELARKVAETEERRKAEEQARQLRLAEEQRKAELARRKQLEEAEQMKKEAALIAKEMEKKQKEYFEKHKLNKMHTPHKNLGTPVYHNMEPVYMADGFEHLNSDEEDQSPQRPVPGWSTNKMRRLAFVYQCEVDTAHIDALFSVRVHDVDLREIFPAIDRARLKRTSSAVWRTPPSRLPALRE